MSARRVSRCICVFAVASAPVLWPVIGWAADSQRPCPTTCRPELLARRSLRATAIASGERPVIDGRLDEAVWERAERATGFVESQPDPGAPSRLISEARVVADREAIYVALTYEDPAPDAIVAPLARRDDEATSDWAFVEIDPRHDRRSGFSFGINPRGVQVDGAWLSDVLYDVSWNAVWEAAARIGPRGWTAEFRIPFSQLPFSLPAAEEPLVWGINFYRYSPHHGESSNWSPRYSGLAGIVSNFNDVIVPAPPTVRRVEITPYVAPRAGDPSGEQLTAGADVRLGLGSSASLTATVRPDFGQVEADPSQVNLTAFELFQPERRPFFLEGLDVYRFDTAVALTTRDVSFRDDTAFYSRRVGRVPTIDLAEGERLAGPTMPAGIAGAAKLAGQTPGGWIVGAFTALTAGQRALVVDDAGHERTATIDVPTLTTVARARRSLGPSGSSVGFFAGGIHRLDTTTPEMAGRAITDQVAVGGDAVMRFDADRYEWGGWWLASRSTGSVAAVSRLTEDPAHYFQRPDAPSSWVRDRTVLAGGAGAVRISRVAGALRWDVTARAVTPDFDVNEIGFQSVADWVVLAGTWRYDRFRPGRVVRHWTVGSDNTGLAWTWAGTPRTQVLSAYGLVDWRTYWQTRVTVTHEDAALSTSWLRGGPAVRLPARDAAAVSLLSNQRRATYWTLGATVARDGDPSAWSASISPLVNIRSTDHVQWSAGPVYRLDAVAWQPTGVVERDGERWWTVARLAQRTLSATARADVVLSPHLSVQFYAQPFATTRRFDRPQIVIAPLTGGLVAGGTAPSPTEDRRFNGSVVVRWEYRAGSFLTVVWNQVQDVAAPSDANVGNAFGRVFHDPAINVLAIKASLRL